jgi:hypothetical protein
MRQIRSIAAILIVWTTAISTLLAGTPHFVCRCPDGSIKHFCFGSTDGPKSSCCTGDSCCPKNASNGTREEPSAPKPRKKVPCCRQENSSPQKSTPVTGRSSVTKASYGLTIHAAGCQKTLLQADDLSVVRTNATSDDGQNFTFDFPPVADTQNLIVSSTAIRAIRQIHSPPLTDLVTMLHRFTI